MNPNDRNLIRQLIACGKAGVIYDFLPAYWQLEAKEKIKAMGEKWCCHPANSVKRLDVPCPNCRKKLCFVKGHCKINNGVF